MFEYLNKLKDFLADRPTYAFLTCSIAVNIYLFRCLMREKDAHFKTIERWLPVADSLTKMLSNAASRARNKKPQTPPTGDQP